MSFNAEELKKAGVASLVSPGDNPEAKLKKHLPVIAVEDGKVTVEVGHGMAEDHWITAIWIEDATGKVLEKVELKPTDTPKLVVETPSVSFTAYEHCNLHGTYASAPFTV
mmetsp:Transcript_40275/g.84479  ORF Transcript_40275/g.84479 Transcript_40275/m.84479 type:complete len:110 (+) Transcript_40275:73-402(+)